MDSNTEISSAALQRLLGIGKSVLSELAQRGIVVKGTKRGTFELEASVSAYCAHLRDMASARGGNRVLAVPSRVRDLSARQNVTLTLELRACLDELADDKAA
jgi:phage terminase Nu1 subunit (DNA packaging protein)